MAVTNRNPITKNDYPLMASIIVEAMFFGDKKTAKRYGISQRSIDRYRKIASKNSELSSYVLEKKQKFEDGWAERIPASIIAGMDFLAEAAKEADHKNPEVIVAITNAIETLAEIGLMKDLIDAKLGKYTIPNRT